MSSSFSFGASHTWNIWVKGHPITKHPTKTVRNQIRTQTQKSLLIEQRIKNKILDHNNYKYTVVLKIGLQ